MTPLDVKNVDEQSDGDCNYNDYKPVGDRIVTGATQSTLGDETVASSIIMFTKKETQKYPSLEPISESKNRSPSNHRANTSLKIRRKSLKKAISPFLKKLDHNRIS